MSGVWSDKHREEYKQQLGLGAAEVAFRRSGRSTRLAFTIFAECYSSPGEWFGIVDHAASYAPQSNRFLFDTMQGMAKDLGFWQLDFRTYKGRFEVRLNLHSKGKDK